jgi:hypothetical protein
MNVARHTNKVRQRDQQATGAMVSNKAARQNNKAKTTTKIIMLKEKITIF